MRIMSKTSSSPVVYGDSDEPFIRPEPIATLFSVSKVTPLYWAKKKGCPHVSLPGGIRFRVSAVKAWLESLDAAKHSPNGS
jgi:hypothetical protein